MRGVNEGVRPRSATTKRSPPACGRFTRSYGAPRIHAERVVQGTPVSRKRVARVMRQAGLAGVSWCKGPRTTRRDCEARPAPDWISANSMPMLRTGCGWPTSPPFPRGQALRADPGGISVLGYRPRRVQPPNPPSGAAAPTLRFSVAARAQWHSISVSPTGWLLAVDLPTGARMRLFGKGGGFEGVCRGCRRCRGPGAGCGRFRRRASARG